jgi:hypothetical protein
LALCARHWFLVSSSSIVPNRRYSEIGFCQSVSGLGDPTTTATSPSGLGLGAIVLAKVPRLASDIGVGSFPPGGVPGMGTEPPSSGEVSGRCTEKSSPSWMEGLNKSYANTPGGVGS